MADPAESNHLPIERLQNLLLGVADITCFLRELAELSTTVLQTPVSSGIMLR
ncbi:MAG: hypothetical protein ACRYG2_07170 [Janthinobacterium lividum]